jgi:hypothetical protein
MGDRYRVALVLAAISAATGCSTPEKLSGSGGSCLMTTDCELGLVCSKDLCTADLSALVNIEDAGSANDAASPPVSDGAPSSAVGSDAGEGSAAAPPDATMPPSEASSPTPEASPAPPDVGPDVGEIVDGLSTPDISVPPLDSGSSPADATIDSSSQTPAEASSD